MIIKEYDNYIAVCDVCEAELPPCETWNKAKQSMKIYHWQIKKVNGAFEDYCKSCKEENEK